MKKPVKKFYIFKFVYVCYFYDFFIVCYFFIFFSFYWSVFLYNLNKTSWGRQ
jgi:hypothetical protein